MTAYAIMESLPCYGIHLSELLPVEGLQKGGKIDLGETACAENISAIIYSYIFYTIYNYYKYDLTMFVINYTTVINHMHKSVK